MSASRLRLLLADGQPLLRTGFRTVLGAEPDVDVVGEAGDGAQAVDLARRLRPDLALVDLHLPRPDGLAATRAIRDLAVHVLLLLPGPPGDGVIRDAVAAGVRGLLPKDVPAPTLVAAIRAIVAGSAVVSPEYLAAVDPVALTPVRLRAAAAPPSHHPATPGRAVAPGPPAGRVLVDVTDREQEVLVNVARGLSNAEIAAQLGVSETTVKTHIGRLFAKLGVRDRVEAVVYAYETGVVRPHP